MPCNEDEQRAACTIAFSWYHQELQKVNSYSIEGFTLPPPGVPCIIHHNDHFQFIKTRKKTKQVCKKSSTQGDKLSANPINIKQPLNLKQRPTEIQEYKSQKPKLTVNVNQSRLFDDEDEDEDDNAAYCLEFLKNSMFMHQLQLIIGSLTVPYFSKFTEEENNE